MVAHTQTAPDLLEQVRTHLKANEAQQALHLLNKTKDMAPALENARGVCLLRLRKADTAVQLYRRLLLASGGVIIRPEAPTEYKVNFAVALLMSGNVAGGLAALDEIHDPQHPSVQKLRAAVGQWKKSLGIVGRVMTTLGAPPQKAVEFADPPGDV